MLINRNLSYLHDTLLLNLHNLLADKSKGTVTATLWGRKLLDSQWEKYTQSFIDYEDVTEGVSAFVDHVYTNYSEVLGLTLEHGECPSASKYWDDQFTLRRERYYNAT